MDAHTLLDSVPASTEALAAAARAAGPAAPVPTCEDWTVADLTAHVVQVATFMLAVTKGDGPPDRSTLDVPDDRSGDGAAAAIGRVHAALGALGPDAPLWNWSAEPDVAAFWFRRLAHEALVHAADAASAAGWAPTVDPALAADGIDELLTVIVPQVLRMGRMEGFEQIGTLHVHCTDTDGEWLVVPSAGNATVTREHAKGDAALRGPAADLLLRLYNRGAGGEVIGDAGVLDRWRTIVRF